VQAAIDAGLAVDAFAPRLSFFFNAHNNFFEEVAKFRAARRLYAHIMRERFGAQSDRSCQLRFHAQTGGSTLTAQQPEVNVVRVALQAMAAVLGGAQSLHTNGRDEALSLPTEQSARIALRTQQVIGYETDVAAVPDPLGGSDYVEQLTNDIEKGAREYIERIDALDGALVAIERGYIQREIQNAAYDYQRAVEDGRRVIVGVNKFQSDEHESPKPFRIDPELERKQIESLRAVRTSRSQSECVSALEGLERAARSAENLIPHILKCCRVFVTVGEISDTLRDVFGQYKESF
jgi:methylmalonyl-CoA mutase N-terminal domain/subunit